ncbi:MAG: type IV pilus twitching motility protein PilT [Actinomycetota bacterium]
MTTPDIDALLGTALDRRASDLHLTVGAAPTIRVDGRLVPLEEPVLDDVSLRSALMRMLEPERRQRFERDLELDFAYDLAGRSRFRANFYVQRGSVGAAFRAIPTSIRPLAELGLPESVGEFAKLPRGLVLVVGVTGSGKSTTLASLLDIVNANRPDHIMTVEDPIEFLHHHRRGLVNQREVGEDTHSFAEALKHVLRQDPDVILVGEMRDLETISTAITAAETGHLVFGTLHTLDAATTVDRIIDVFPVHQQAQIRIQLAMTLRGVVAQQLLPRASGPGRAVASEVMVVTPAIRNLIREGKTFQIPSAIQSGGRHGMLTMDQSLATLVSKGHISESDAFERCQDVQGLAQLLGVQPPGTAKVGV